MHRWLVLGALLACASPAEAGPKNRKTARLLSGVSASVSGGVVLSGFLFAQDSKSFNLPVLYTGIGLLFVTPSAGQFYSGQYLTIGMGIRAAAAGFAIYTTETQTQPVMCDLDPPALEPRCESFKEAAIPMLGIAAIAFIGGAWYDILDAPDAADRYNKKHGFTIAPTVVPGPQGPAPGLMVGGFF